MKTYIDPVTGKETVDLYATVRPLPEEYYQDIAAWQRRVETRRGKHPYDDDKTP